MQKDFKTNMHRITVDNVVPKSLVFYVFGSVLNAFIDWKRMKMSRLNLSKWTKSFINLSMSKHMIN